MRPSRALALAALALAARPAPGSAQSDTLRLALSQALATARERSPAVLQAAADRRARAAQAQAGNAALLPRLSAELGVMRSNDPVAVFGSRLRQGSFGSADFALDALNHPDALTDVATALALEQPLWQPEALAARRAGRAAARASASAQARVGEAVSLEVVRTYYGARLALDRIAVIQEALGVAGRVRDQVGSLRRNGTVTLVDEQLARSRVSELEAQLAAAEAGRVAAEDALWLTLGEPPGRPLLPTDTLVLPPEVTLDSAGAVERRDVAALRAALQAAEAGVTRARMSWVPSAGAFASLDWHSGQLALAGGPRHWTTGVVLRWTPFRGMADLGQLHAAQAERDAARERLADLERRVLAEARAARADHAAALAGVRAAEAALQGAAQAARVAGVRYAEGVGTLTDLLAVRAQESAQRLARLDAMYRARVAEAALALALGRMPE